MEEEFKVVVKDIQAQQDKNLYLQDLIEKKEHDLTAKKKDLATAQKKIQELNKIIDDSKSHRKSTGSLTGKNEVTSSFKSDRKKR